MLGVIFHACGSKIRPLGAPRLCFKLSVILLLWLIGLVKPKKNHHLIRMDKKETTITFRQPATANLQVDSFDRNQSGYPSPFNFFIQKDSSIFNGFFTRIGTTEMVLEWDYPTIQGTGTTTPNNVLIFDISGFGSNPITITSQNKFAVTAADVLDNFVAQVNDLSGTTGFFMEVNRVNGVWTLQGFSTAPGNAALAFAFRYTTLAKQFNFGSSTVVPPPPGNFSADYKLFNVDLRRLRYIDIVSPQLTYNQDLKDATTNPISVDVLNRWYFSYDQEMTYDTYDLPIHMGYSPFSIRRIYNPPKQIKWDPIQPVGQISFEVWGELVPQDNIADYPYNPLPAQNFFKTNYLMTLQVSEN